MKRWPQVLLSELAADVPYACIGGPFGSELTTRDYVDSPGVPVIRGSNLAEDGFVDEGFVYVSERKAQALHANQARPGDVVFTQRGTIGQVAIIPQDVRHERYVLSQSQMKLAPDHSRIDPRFLVHYFRSRAVLNFLARNTLATGVPHINLNILRRVPVPLPPLPEQRRIAEILDKADALRAKRRAALAQLDTLTQSIFLDMFGDPATNPKGWPKRKLVDLCSIYAQLVDPTRAEYRHLLHYGPDRIERDTGTLLPAQTAEEDGVTSSKFVFDEQDILYSKIRPNLNKVALGTRRALCSADVYPVRVRQDLITREFLWCLLRNRHFLAYTAEFSNRANIPKINRDQLLGYPAVCPPISIQRDFTRRAAAVDRLRTAQRHATESTDTLFVSLQHRAFRGEL